MSRRRDRYTHLYCICMDPTNPYKRTVIQNFNFTKKKTLIEIKFNWQQVYKVNFLPITTKVNEK